MIGELSGLGSAVIWAIISSLMRALSEKISPPLLNGLRTAFVALTIFLIVVLLGRAGELLTVSPETLVALVVSGVLSLGLGDVLFLQSMKTVGASRALPVSSTNPLMTLGLAVVFLGERVTWLGVAGTLLVVCGISLLAFPYGSSLKTTRQSQAADRMGVLQALLAGCCWSVAAIILKSALANIDILTANWIRMSLGSAMLLGFEAFHSGPRRISVGISRRSLVILAVAGVLGAASSLLYLSAVYYAGAAKATVLNSTSPLFGLPLSIFFLHEKVNFRIVAGTLLAVSGIWLVLWG